MQHVEATESSGSPNRRVHPSWQPTGGGSAAPAPSPPSPSLHQQFEQLRAAGVARRALQPATAASTTALPTPATALLAGTASSALARLVHPGTASSAAVAAAAAAVPSPPLTEPPPGTRSSGFGSALSLAPTLTMNLVAAGGLSGSAASPASTAGGLLLGAPGSLPLGRSNVGLAPGTTLGLGPVPTLSTASLMVRRGRGKHFGQLNVPSAPPVVVVQSHGSLLSSGQRHANEAASRVGRALLLPIDDMLSNPDDAPG